MKSFAVVALCLGACGIDEATEPSNEGVEIVPVYDRSDLIHRAISTLTTTLLEESLVVAFISFISCRGFGPSRM